METCRYAIADSIGIRSVRDFRDSVISVGGNNQDGSQALTFALRWDGRDIQVAPMLPLPMPCSNMSGGIMGTTLHVAGGQPEHGEVEARGKFWALDLSGQPQAWRKIAPWLGPGRQLSVAGGEGGQFSLFSGITHQLDETGKLAAVVPYLRDAYCCRASDLRWDRRIVDWSPDRSLSATSGRDAGLSHGSESMVITRRDDGRLDAGDRSNGTVGRRVRYR